jgi:outer membrane protein insertion porin family
VRGDRRHAAPLVGVAGRGYLPTRFDGGSGFGPAQRRREPDSAMHPEPRTDERPTDSRRKASRRSRRRGFPAVAATLALSASAAALPLPQDRPATERPRVATPMSIDEETLADRPIATVTFRGLQRVARQLVENNVRVAAGQPFDAAIIRQDVTNLYRLGQFATITAEAALRPDGTVDLVYAFVEQPLIREIGFSGNKIISDQDLRAAVPLFAGGPRDDFLLEQSVFRLRELYRKRGNYLAEISVDETMLRQDGILVFRIIEGPRVRVEQIQFVGNSAFTSDQLHAQIRSRTAIPLFRKGQLDEELLVDDVAALDRFYKGEGFVDVRIDRRIELSADSREAKIVFVVDEGRRYRLREVLVEGFGVEGPVPLRVFSPEQIRALFVMRRGDWFTKLLLDRSTNAIRDAYFVLGYVDVEIEVQAVKVGESPEVDLVLSVREGSRTIAGLVVIQGNFLTRDKVIRRLVRIQPGRPLDGREIEKSKRRIERSNLFNDVRITAQRPRPGEEDPLGTVADEEVRAAVAAGNIDLAERLDRQVRDVLVEIKEKNTGSINFGLGVGTDSGIFGEISITQRNFDIADPPATIEEFVSGRSFRGAGQVFNITIAPGTEISSYSINFVEPHLFESDVALRLSSAYRQRFFNFHDEDRFNVGGGISTRLGDLWVIGANLSFNRVKLSGFSPSTPIEIFEDRGPASLVGANVSLVRSDFDRNTRPTRGTQLELSIGQTVDLETDETWTTVRGSGTALFTVAEDYLGRRSTLKLSGDVTYLFGGDPPVYERLYLGGRSLRGFEFRTVSPKSRGTLGAPNTPNKEPVGGTWLVFLGAQYELPVFGEFISLVAFVDSGTVLDSPGFDPYRVGVGAGLRLYLPQLGPNPLAFDFAVPLLEDDGDDSQVFSFAIELPF